MTARRLHLGPMIVLDRPEPRVLPAEQRVRHLVEVGHKASIGKKRWVNEVTDAKCTFITVSVDDQSWSKLALDSDIAGAHVDLVETWWHEGLDWCLAQLDLPRDTQAS